MLFNSQEFDSRCTHISTLHAQEVVPKMSSENRQSGGKQKRSSDIESPEKHRLNKKHHLSNSMYYIDDVYTSICGDSQTSIISTSSDTADSNDASQNGAKSTVLKMTEVAKFGALLRGAMTEKQTADVFRDMFKPLLTSQTQELKWEMEKMKQNILLQDERLDDLEREMREIKEQKNQSEAFIASNERLEKLERQMKEIDEQINQPEAFIASNERLEDLEREMKEMKEKHNQINSKLVTDQPKVSMTSTAEKPPLQMQQNYTDEISKTIETKLEKLRKDQELNKLRQRSIIIHGAAETEEKDFQKRIRNEEETIKSIVMKLDVSTTVVGHSRLGKFSTEKPRLLRVTVENEGARNEILRNSTKQTEVLITPDRSKEERDARKKLREEFKLRKEQGETNIFIKNNQIVTIPIENRARKPSNKPPFHI